MQQGKSTSEAQPAPTGTGDEAEGESITADICVIGADPGGLAVATAAAAFGRRVVLIERDQVGAEALRYGPLAMRALAAVGNRAHAMRTASTFGIPGTNPDIDLRTVNAHVQGVLAEAAPNFAAERFVGLGIRVIQAAARFINKRTVMAGEHRIRARRFVIATGSVAAIPAIPRLNSVPYLTTETIFSNHERLHNLIVVGGAAGGLELAQACSRLGFRVMVLEAGKALGEEDPELAKFVLDQLAAEGIAIHENTKVDGVEGGLGRVRVNVTVGEEKHVVEGSHLLIAAGRKPAIADLGLEAAGIRYDERGIKVNSSLKTTNRRVFAIGQAAAGLPRGEAADYYAGLIVRRALLHMPARVEAQLIPRVLLTDPELAYVGLSEAEAAKSEKKINVLRWPYRENLRAAAERALAGHVKVITNRGGKVLGAGIVGAQAGELIQIWALAIARGLNIKDMQTSVAAHPTLSEINKSAAASYYAATPANPTLRKVIDFLARFG